MKIGSNLKRAREKKKLSQQEVADLLSVSQKTLSNMESDKSNPTIRQLAMIGDLYELNIIDLLSQHGVSLKPSNIQSKENEVIIVPHYIVEIKGLYEQLIEEKDSKIELLKEYIERLQRDNTVQKG